MLLIISFVINGFIALAAIVLHYEVLYWLNQRLARMSHIQARYKVLIAVGTIFLAHVAEIWLFACAYLAMLQIPEMGSLVGKLSDHGAILDCAYFSFITFTTVGYGEIFANGYLRYLTGVEALCGFILITWSASFLFLEMQKYWSSNHPS